MKFTVSNSMSLYQRKMLILVLGVALSFFSSMSKMLVPGPIYTQLQGELLFDPAQIAALGAVYMYAYATSQLLMGIYSDRYGGVRLFLIGGTLFALGSCGFPLTSNLGLLKLCRIITGLGAGTIFLGEAKLLNDLFPKNFALMLGVVLMIGYFGPVAGTVPMVWLIAQLGWRGALFVPGIISLVLMVGIYLLAPGTIKPTQGGQSLRPFFTMLKNRAMWVLCLSSSFVFGSYYVLLTQLGQKCVEDFYGVDKYWASLCVTGLAIIVAINNVGFNFLLKLTGNNRKRLIQLGFGGAALGAAIGGGAFYCNWSVGALLVGFVLLAMPAGFFSLYGGVAKELNPPEVTGLALAVLNFSAFVFIALFGNISGWILNCWTPNAQHVFPGSAYGALFVFLTAANVGAVVLSFFIRDLDKKSR